MTSYTGPFFNELYLIKYYFSTGVFSTLGPSMLQFMRTGSTLYVCLIALMMIAQPQKGKERAEGLGVSVFCFALAILLLSQSGTTSNVLEVFWIIEDMALAVSIEILQKIPTYANFGKLPYPLDLAQAEIQLNNETVVNGYAVLAALIEQQMYGIIKLLGQIAYGNGDLLTPPALIRALMSIIGMLPFIFVLGIFAAFMAEAMFKYVAMAVATPILIAIFPIKFFRPFSTAGIRILIGAFFTLVFAAGAMGFTMIAVDNFKGGIATKLEAAQQAGTGSIRYKLWCKDSPPIWSGAWPDEGYEPYTLYDKNDVPPLTEAECQEAEKLSSIGAWIVFEPEFIMLVVIGFLSVLLHLSAKTLASNISGANDGPGPAAAVVMGAKAAAAGGAGIAFKYGGGALFGQGGLGSSVSDVMQGNSRVTAGGVQGFGQSLASHGAVGTAARMMNPYRGRQTPPSPDNNPGFDNIGSNRFSTGGGSGSMFGSQQQQREFANVIAQAIKDSGIGRNRDGS